MTLIARVMGALSLIAVCLTGCAPKGGLVGTWRGEGTGPGGTTATTTITFRNDGTFRQIVKEGLKTLEMTGRYQAADGRMTQTVESVTVDGKPAQASGRLKEDMGYVLGDDDQALILGTSGTAQITFKRVNE